MGDFGRRYSSIGTFVPRYDGCYGMCTQSEFSDETCAMLGEILVSSDTNSRSKFSCADEPHTSIAISDPSVGFTGIEVLFVKVCVF
jgi:hypothetical protein